MASQQPGVSNIDSLAWQNVRVPGLLAIWWLLLVLQGVLDRAVFSQSMRDGSGGVDPSLNMASDALGIVAAVLAILIVRRISARQKAKSTTLSV